MPSSRSAESALGIVTTRASSTVASLVAPPSLAWASGATRVTPPPLEAGGSVRRTEPGRAVVTGLGRAEVAAAAAAVRSGCHIEQPARLRVRVRAVGDRRGVAGERVDTRDQRGRQARAADRRPSAEASALDLAEEVAVRVVHAEPGVGVGDRGDVRDRTTGASGVGLPGLLHLVRRA